MSANLLPSFPAIEFDAAEFFYQLAETPAEKLEGVWQCLADHGVTIEADYPKSTRSVYMLCVALGFDATIPKIAKLIEDGSIAPPPLFAGVLAWRAENVAQLATVLHERRAWLPGRFWELKTAAEKQRDVNKAEHAKRMVDYIRAMPQSEVDQLATENNDMGELARITNHLRARGAEL